VKKIENNEMDGACSAYGGEEGFGGKSLTERDHSSSSIFKK
jgi:hypothetical protein